MYKRQSLHFITQIMRGLSHAHSRGIVHRDIKPQNIMLLDNGQLRMMDFGIARISRAENQIQNGKKAMGSVHYISPEQAKGEETDPKSDIYSVGVMMYEMLSGRLPFDADDMVEVARKQIRDTPKPLAELAPEANPGAPVIPQLLAKDGELAAWMIGQLRALGYTEVNLNLGCPAGTVTAKGKGSGMLRDLAKVDAFLDGVFSRTEGPVSVKTRLGVEKPEEFAAILEIYNRYPISELTIHPRVMRQQYRGQADRAAFAAALPRCTMPVCYNGDVTTAAQLHALEEEFSTLSGIMVGRGLIADPALFRRARGGAPATKEELRGFLTDLYHGYTELFGSAGCAISRMKGHWFYLIHCFAGAEKLEKQLKKLREPWEYEVVVNQIFTLPLVEND